MGRMNHLPTEPSLPRLSDLLLPRAAVRVLAAMRNFIRQLWGCSVSRTTGLGELSSSCAVTPARSTSKNCRARRCELGRSTPWRAATSRESRGRWGSASGRYSGRARIACRAGVGSTSIRRKWARLRRFMFPQRPGWLQLATCACHSAGSMRFAAGPDATCSSSWTSLSYRFRRRW